MMAEDFVSRDQHRVDMAELRGEFKEEIAGLRQDMTVMRGELKEDIAGVRQEIIALTKRWKRTSRRCCCALSKSIVKSNKSIGSLADTKPA